MNGELVSLGRNAALDDEAWELEVLDDDDGLAVDGSLEEVSLFRKLLLGFRVGTSGGSSELCNSLAIMQRKRRGVGDPPCR